MTETTKFTGRGQLIDRLSAQVGSREKAMKILQRRGQADKNGKLTEKGEARNKMSAGERAIDRASKRSGKPASAYRYVLKTNTAVLR